MIICCYTAITRQWSEQELADKLVLFPEKAGKEVLRKKNWMDRQLSVSGKLLLVHLLKYMGLDRELSLPHLKYTEFHRPYFDVPFDFNIAHSGSIAICCGVLNGKVGIDIEQTQLIDLDDFTDHFTENEWNKINQASDRCEKFYNYWTSKEAILKCLGTGLHTPLLSIDVSGSGMVIYDECPYYVRSLQIIDGYKCAIATTTRHTKIHLIPVIL